MAKNKDAHHDDHRPNVKLYMGVFAALLVLTVVTVWISKFHLPRPQAVALGLLVALVKGSLVAAFFMHLWGEKPLIWRVLGVTAFFAAILVLPLTDAHLVLDRVTHRISVAEQGPHHATLEGGSAQAHEEKVTEKAALPVPAKPAPKKPAAKKAH